MSSVLYYSNFCPHSQTLLKCVSKWAISQDQIHFICIDRREKDANGKTFVYLENNSKVVLPENVTKVPALLLLNQGFNVLYGEDINKYLEPPQKNQMQKATMNDMEPMAFSLGGGGFGNVVSDNYSFLDQSSDEMTASGNGGLRQIHSYALLNHNDQISTPENDDGYKGSNKISKDLTVEKLQEQRNSELVNLKQTQSRPVI